MNTKTIYIILAIVLVGALSYYFLSQPATNQLPSSDDANSSVSDEAQDEVDYTNSTSGSVSDVGEGDYLTYVSEDYGFSIDYPKDWYWDATTAGKLIIMSYETKQALDLGQEAPVEVGVNTYRSVNSLPNNSNKLSLEEWINWSSQNDPTLTGATEVMVDGVTGYQAVSHGMFDSYVVYVENSGMIYEIYAANCVLPGIEEKTIIDSFKFL